MADDIVKQRAHAAGHVVVTNRVLIQCACTCGRVIEATRGREQRQRTGGGIIVGRIARRAGKCFETGGRIFAPSGVGIKCVGASRRVPASAGVVGQRIRLRIQLLYYSKALVKESWRMKEFSESANLNAQILEAGASKNWGASS